MCCLALAAGFIGPRFAFFLLWIFDSGRVNAVYSSWVWPLLGLIFAPWTFLFYTLAWGPVNGVSGAGWIAVALGVFLDVVTYSARAAQSRYEAGRV
jgi:hypothetical protein